MHQLARRTNVDLLQGKILGVAGVTSHRSINPSPAPADTAIARVPGFWPLRERSRSIRSGGLDWHVQVGGQGPNVLMLHGTGSSAHSWSDVVRALGNQVTVIAPDLPGHGFTEGASLDELTLPGISQRLDELLADLGVGPIDLVVGHSAGAALALRWALGQRQAPHCVVGMNPALIAPPATYHQFVAPLLHPLATSYAMASLFSSIGVSAGMVRRLLRSTNSLLSVAQRDCYEVLFRRPSHVRGAMGLMAAADLPSLLPALASLSSRQMFVLGTADRWIPRRQLEGVLARYAPSAEVIYWPGGHLLHEAEPDRCALMLLDCLPQEKAAPDHS